MKKITIGAAQIGDKIRVPITEGGEFTYDSDGALFAKKSYIVATVIDRCRIGWSDDQKIKVKHFRCEVVPGTMYESKFPNLDRSIRISDGVPCVVIKDKKPSTKFLFAALGAGAVMNSLFRTSGNRAVDSKIREISK